MGIGPTPKFNVPKLTKSNYPEWKYNIDGALYLSNCKEYIENDVKFDDTRSDPLKAYYYITAYTLINNTITPEIHQQLGGFDSLSF